MDEVQTALLIMDGSVSSSSSDENNTSSSSSCDSSEENDFNPLLEDEIDEEALLFPLLQFLLTGRKRHRVQNFLETVHAKSNDEFKKDFRLERPTVYRLLESLEVSGFIPTQAFGKEKKPAELCLLMTLWFLGNRESYRLLSNLFDISISSVCRIVRRVIKWLCTLVHEFIRWPEGSDLIRITQVFENIAGLQGCIGALDGTHIKINQPEVENSREYFNRKQCYSILLQGIVDCDMKFTNIYCGDPGSFHDSRMLRRSNIFQLAEEDCGRMFPHNTFLIADKGYNGVAQKWLVYPFRDNGNLTLQQSEFNTRVSKTRVVVEQAFGILKCRFQLLQMIQLRNIPFIINIIVACCILHNICLINGDNGNNFYDGELVQEQDISDNEAEVDGRNNQQRASSRRDSLFRSMYQANI